MKNLVPFITLLAVVIGCTPGCAKVGDRQPPPRADQQGGDNSQRYSLEQAVSDRAQLNTIAFNGLAFITGDFGAATFIPPGKVCDFFGFQYMRDIDVAETGHNPMFLDRVAANVLYVLSDEQRNMFADLANKQAIQFQSFAVKRYPLIKAFYRQLNGEIPNGSTGLNKDAVMQYVGDLFAFDAELSLKRAEMYGKIVSGLTSEQKAYIARMKFGDFNSWPNVDMEQYKLPRGTDKMKNVAYMTYASEFFSWYAGSVEADVYFCPERHGTYFGGFYMKDMPAMGQQNYNISTSLTGDSGEAFLNSLTAEQQKYLTSIPDLQRKALQEVIEVRRAISTELRKYLSGGQADKQKVLALGRRYGELDGEMSDYYTVAFAKVNRTLTKEQRQTLVKLRNLDGYTSPSAFIYSDPVPGTIKLPNTDNFFFAPKKSDTGVASHTTPKTTFVLHSPVVANGGQLPAEFTGDGSSATLPLEWSGAPTGTKSYTLIMHHIAPDKTKWYWTLYDIPAQIHSLAKNSTKVGILGNNSVNSRVGYAPPHSKGPGEKTYILTIYALSEKPQIKVSEDKVSRDVLLAAMKDNILATAELQVVYSRPAGATN